MEEMMTTCCPLAPEDIQKGQYAVVLHAISEFLQWRGLDDAWQTPHIVRIQHLPFKCDRPVEVLEVCLPYVFVKTAKGKTRMLDVRRCRLARVSDAFGQLALTKPEAERKEEPAKAEETAKAATDDG